MAYKRPDGRWQTTVYLGEGNRKTITAKTQKELKAKEIELKSQLNKGIDIVSQQDTFKMWQKRVCEIKEKQLQQKVYRDFKYKTEAFLCDLGDMRIVDIRQIHIQPIIDKLAIENPRTHKPTARKTLSMYIVYLSHIFENAIENRVIEFNPCKYVRIPNEAVKKQERRSLDFDEQQMITDTPHKAQLSAYLALFAGLRRSEITALLWSDIDLVNKTITVNKAVDLYSNTVKDPKTSAGYRTVTIPDILVDYLKEQPRTSVYVVTNYHNNRMTNKSWQCLWNDYMLTLDRKYGLKKLNFDEKVPLKSFNKFKDISIKPFGLHDLRHTCATNMYFAGVNAVVCKNQLGHSDIVTTLNIYTHCQKQEAIDSVNEINEYLKKRIKTG